MKKVIIIPEIQENETTKKAAVFTHYLNKESGWKEALVDISRYCKIIYLGRCDDSGDMFAAYGNGHISIYKGHLNDGIY